MATLTVTEQNFTETIEGNQIVLLDFWASWCGPCMQFGPIYDQVSEDPVSYTHLDVYKRQVVVLATAAL